MPNLRELAEEKETSGPRVRGRLSPPKETFRTTPEWMRLALGKPASKKLDDGESGEIAPELAPEFEVPEYMAGGAGGVIDYYGELFENFVERVKWEFENRDGFFERSKYQDRIRIKEAMEEAQAGRGKAQGIARDVFSPIEPLVRPLFAEAEALTSEIQEIPHEPSPFLLPSEQTEAHKDWVKSPTYKKFFNQLNFMTMRALSLPITFPTDVARPAFQDVVPGEGTWEDQAEGLFDMFTNLPPQLQYVAMRSLGYNPEPWELAYNGEEAVGALHEAPESPLFALAMGRGAFVKGKKAFRPGDVAETRLKADVKEAVTPGPSFRSLAEEAVLPEGKIKDVELKPPKKVEITPESVAKDLDVKFNGMQERVKKPSVFTFTDNKTGSTFLVENLKDVKTRLAEVRTEFEKAKKPTEPPSAAGPAGAAVGAGLLFGREDKEGDGRFGLPGKAALTAAGGFLFFGGKGRRTKARLDPKLKKEFVKKYGTERASLLEEVSGAVELDAQRTPQFDIMKKASDNVLKNFSDILTPIRHAREEFERSSGTKLTTEKDPFSVATAVKETSGTKATSWIEDGPTDFDGNIVGKGLKDIIKPVSEDIHAAMDYAYAKHALERWEFEKNPGIPKEKAQEIVSQFGSIKKFETFSKELAEYRDHILQYVVDAGGLSPDVAAKFREMYKRTLPLYRVGKEGVGHGAGPRKAFGDLGQPYMRARGGEGAIVNPIASLIRETERMISWGDRARVGQLLFEMVEESGGNIPGFAEVVPLPKEAVRMGTEGILKKLEQEGVEINLKGKQLDDFMTQWVTASHGIPKENVVMVYKDGKPQALKLTGDLYDAIKGIDPWLIPPALKALAFPKKAVAAGATGLRASFGLVTNPIRDIFTFFARTIDPKANIPGIGIPIAAFRATKASIQVGLRKFRRATGIKAPYPKEFDLYYRLGGEYGTFFNTELPKSIRKAKGLIKDALRAKQTENVSSGLKKAGINTVHTLLHPIDLYREIINIPETGPRMAEFQMVYKKEMKDHGVHRRAWINALNAKQDATLNFSRAGAYGRMLNQFIPFFNPSLQDFSLVARTFRDHPARTTMRGVANLTIPTLTLWYMNKDEDWYKALPKWQKVAFWNFKLPFKDDIIWRIPKPFLFGGVFANLPEATADAFYRDSPEEAKDHFSAILESNLPPFMPAFMGPSLEVGMGETGYSFFQDRFIVSPFEVMYKAPEERYSRYTTEFSKAAGKLLNVSPKKVDHWIAGQTGGMGIDIINAAEAVFDPGPATKELANMPFFGRLVSRSPFLNYFYQKRQYLREQALHIDKKNRTDNETQILKDLSRANAYGKRLTRIGKLINGIHEDKSLDRAEATRMLDSLSNKADSLARHITFQVIKSR